MGGGGHVAGGHPAACSENDGPSAGLSALGGGRSTRGTPSSATYLGLLGDWARNVGNVPMAVRWQDSDPSEVPSAPRGY